MKSETKSKKEVNSSMMINQMSIVMKKVIFIGILCWISIPEAVLSQISSTFETVQEERLMNQLGYNFSVLVNQVNSREISLEELESVFHPSLFEGRDYKGLLNYLEQLQNSFGKLIFHSSQISQRRTAIFIIADSEKSGWMNLQFYFDTSDGGYRIKQMAFATKTDEPQSTSAQQRGILETSIERE